MSPVPRKELGRQGESAAEQFLRRRHRYRVLERNFACRWGELDLVCLDGKTLVFVEVRSAGETGLDRPEESVTERKQRKIIKAAKYFIQARRIKEMNMRFDVLGVTFRPGRETGFALYQNAFELPPV